MSAWPSFGETGVVGGGDLRVCVRVCCCSCDCRSKYLQTHPQKKERENGVSLFKMYCTEPVAREKEKEENLCPSKIH